MKKTDKTNSIESTTIRDFFGIDYFKSIFNKVFQYAKANFPTFSALFSAFTFVLFWYVRALAFSFYSGKFDLYHMSKTYIDINDHIFYEIITIIVYSIIIIFSNILFISIRISPPKNLLKILKIILFFIFESFVIFFIMSFLIDANIKQILSDLKGNYINIIILCVILLSIVFVLNIIGIEISFMKSKNFQKKTDTTQKNSLTFGIIAAIFANNIFWRNADGAF